MQTTKPYLPLFATCANI